ncbi:MAG: hypothetical protein ACD_66C00259G0001, partial [uncultured bacterium]
MAVGKSYFGRVSCSHTGTPGFRCEKRLTKLVLKGKWKKYNETNRA